MISGSASARSLFLAAGPLLFIAVQLMPLPDGMTPASRAALASAAWIALWWITEAVPIPVTSLLPIVLFPSTGTLDMARTTASYGHPMVFLYMGGFMIALAIERWHLHRRIALAVVQGIGTNPQRIILGFMVATFLLSMWISNTATALMMLPIALAVSARTRTPEWESDSEQPEYLPFALPLMLGLAYSASMGGICTLVGTPTNAVLAAVVRNLYQDDIDFLHWFAFAAPPAVLMLVLGWWYLVRIAFFKTMRTSSPDLDALRREVAELGPFSPEERKVLIVFGLTAIAWMSRGFILERLLPEIDDTVIAISGALLLFLVPGREKGQRLLDWKTALKLPWGILILFGGGLALAEAFQESGLSVWIGQSFHGLRDAPPWLILVTVTVVVNFLTEITSNVATASLLLPILATLAPVLGLHPYVLMMAATISASCAYMLPVATPPNAVVFSSGVVRMRDMARHGFAMNLLSIAITVLAVLGLLPLIWGVRILH
jgi:solute carrier family 13 (sodium-dependent dicarboxylate transporter), member 2/3/5